ncbi:transcriptional regulator, LysR family [Octadecabacter temperatus]|uniref:HTH-type transcriptional regulator CynR n=1 Tax=Octadecabacter temperatus TaxID=1458307 RepID=A0A0K0Y936_9RHOB|nr:LysR family transcriptional regulator [Octadecabacter temperatus]AKS47377.1 HTH-type transcriptional regulator CynR [Octadecabacter temperatus]SIO43356.1 transcriptional regulator, LysR family [Octadecabacter temperatus]
MDIDPDRLDWAHLRSFLATAETASLSGAARKLGLTQPTLSRQVAALEENLSVLLFERVGRGLELTDAGRELLVHTKDMGAAAQRLAMTATAQRSDIGGKVRITASDIFATIFLPKIVVEIRKRAPGLSIEIVATNDISDLMRREADIAIRNVRPEQPDLVARLAREAKGCFYASNEYLARRGTPKTRAELATHDWISFGSEAQMVAYLNSIDVPITLDAFKVGSESGVVSWELARAGMGISPMDSIVGDADRSMERLLPGDLEIMYPVWLVTHREVHTSPRIRLVFDILAEALSDKGSV